MSAETLRRAAALMRERATRSIRSPWHVVVHDDGRAWLCETASDGREVKTLAMHGFPSTAEHIASWHPAVALAVADLLDALATDRELDPYLTKHFDGPALDAARAYLGEQP